MLNKGNLKGKFHSKNGFFSLDRKWVYPPLKYCEIIYTKTKSKKVS